MSRELYEKVDTRTLKPGDVVVNYAGENVVWDAGDSKIVNDNPAGPWHMPCLFRRIPDAEDPRVLRRALRNVSKEVIWADDNGIDALVEDWIDQARKELESEAGE